MAIWKIQPFRGGEASSAPVPGPAGERGPEGPPGPMGITYVSNFRPEDLGAYGDNVTTEVLANDANSVDITLSHKLKSGKCGMLIIGVEPIIGVGNYVDCEIYVDSVLSAKGSIPGQDCYFAIPVNRKNDSWDDYDILVRLTVQGGTDIPAQTLTVHVTGLESDIAEVLARLKTINGYNLVTIDGKNILAHKPV